MTRRVDPVHFFDGLGQSLLTVSHQSEIIDRLAEENEELKRMLGEAVRRLRGDADDEPTHPRVVN
jgi:hypothetical protein